MFGLGVRGPHEVGPRDLHQGSFDVDERCIQVGINLFCATALLNFE
jgi:amidohydrolase